MHAEYDPKSGVIVLTAREFIAAAESPEELWAMIKAYRIAKGKPRQKTPAVNLNIALPSGEAILDFMQEKGVSKLRARTRTEFAVERKRKHQEKMAARAKELGLDL